MQRQTVPATPFTLDGLNQHDHLPVSEALFHWWVDPGVNPEWHKQQRQVVRRAMPGVARSLDRLAAEHGRFVCPRCEAVSADRNDVQHGYCGRCHDFTGTPYAVDSQQSISR